MYTAYCHRNSNALHTLIRCKWQCLKLSLPTAGSLKLFGSEFHIDRLATEKANQPYVRTAELFSMVQESSAGQAKMSISCNAWDWDNDSKWLLTSYDSILSRASIALTIPSPLMLETPCKCRQQ